MPEGHVYLGFVRRDLSKLFTDEKKFELFGNSLRQYVRRLRGERYMSDCVSPTVKHGGGSLWVWGSIAYSGVGHLYKITDNLTAPKYKQILIHHAVPVGKALIGNSFVFQHDYDPKHTAGVIRKYLENKKRDGSLTVLNWLAQSPDMNIIEIVWTYVEKEKVKRAPVNSALTTNFHILVSRGRGWLGISQTIKF